MPVGALSSAVSGIHSAFRRIGVSAHNLANLQTEDLRPLKASQSSLAEGGSEVEVTQAEAPEEVDVADELVQQMIANLQARASMRTIETEADLIGRLIDIDA